MTSTVGLSPAGTLVARAGQPFVLIIGKLDADGARQDLTGHTFALVYRRSSQRVPLFTLAAELAQDALSVIVFGDAGTATAIYEAGRAQALSYDIVETTGGASVSEWTGRVTVEPGPDLPSDIVPAIANLPSSVMLLRPDAIAISQLGPQGYPAEQRLYDLGVINAPTVAAMRDFYANISQTAAQAGLDAAAEQTRVTVLAYTRPYETLVGDEYRQMTGIAESGFISGVFDNAERRSGGWRADGSLEARISRVAGSTTRPAAPESGYVHAVRDSAERAQGGHRRDGGFEAPAFRVGSSSLAPMAREGGRAYAYHDTQGRCGGGWARDLGFEARALRMDGGAIEPAATESGLAHAQLDGAGRCGGGWTRDFALVARALRIDGMRSASQAREGGQLHALRDADGRAGGGLRRDLAFEARAYQHDGGLVGAGSREAGALAGALDCEGRQFGGWRRDGRFEAGGVSFGSAAARESGALALAVTGAQPVALIRRDGFSGVPTDARLVRANRPAKGYVAIDALPDINCWGDSQTQGVGLNYQWWQHLRDMLAAHGMVRSINNFGAGGQDSSQIAARFDAVAIVATVAGNTIPADGTPVAVTALSPSLITTTSDQQISGSIAGVRGMFVRSGDGAIAFWRAARGPQVSAPPGSSVRIDAAERATCTNIFFSGRNDADFAWHPFLENVLGMEARQALASPRSLWLGITNGSTTAPDGSATGYSDERQGTTRYIAMRRNIDRMKDLFGPRFVDLHNSLIDEGPEIANWLTASGYFGVFGMSYSAHAQDTDNIATRVVPASLRTDGLHFNTFGHAVVAHLVFRKLLALGF